MGKIPTDQKLKSWSEVNKTRKEEKRKWKEQNLARKIEKVKRKEELQSQQSNESLTNPQTLQTVSMALPGSIMETAQSEELRAYLAGQIARAACIFQIDEIVIFDDYGDEASAKKSTLEDNYGVKHIRRSCVQLGRILQYLECPQYLRKSFFPIHNDLRFCGLLNPLNAPHHLGRDDVCQYREGVVLNKPVKPGKGSIVNVGLLKDVQVDKLLTSGIRCTVKLLSDQNTSKKLKGVVVAPSTPRIDKNIYWGYTIRLANSLSKVFSQSPHKDGYDLTVGTSDKGDPIDEFSCPAFNHLLIVFGGVQGLEFALDNDPVLTIDDPKLLFDGYLNAVPGQGSKTIRTEEAILISLAALRPKIKTTNM